jgi:flagellar hook protein FlgE
MTVLGSMFTGISGLNAHSNALQSIGSNIANVSTTGFKKSRVAFEEVLRGVTLTDLGRTLSQGGLEGTENVTDLAISGDGYFIVSDGTPFYSRAGQFSIDKDGNMVNPSGFFLQGYAIDTSGNVSGTLSDINLNTFSAPPQASTTFNLAANLNASAANSSNFTTAFTVYNSLGGPVSLTMDFVKDTSNEIKPAQVVTASGAGTDTATSGGTYTGTENQTYTLTVGTGGTLGVDSIVINVATSGSDTVGAFTVSAADTAYSVGSLGATAAFTSTDGVLEAGDSWSVSALSNEWDWTVTPSDGSSTSSGSISFDQNGLLSMAFDGSGNTLLALDGSGSPIGTITEPTISVTGLSNGAADLSVTWDLVDVSNSSDMTGFDQPSATFFTSQNGRAPGTIQDLTIGEDGVITGIFSNGGVLPVYQVALADFAAAAELEFRGLNLFRESSDSGQAVVGAPGQGGLGKVDSRSLEASNVDLTSEFVNLIAAQRGFQANTRVISVGNEVLLEMVNLIR